MSKFSGNAYLVLATFEKIKASSEFLSPDAVGAVGYMAVRAINVESVESQLRSELAEIDLTLIETDEIQPLPSIDELNEIDEHLADKVSNWEPGRATCWGTVHQYLSSEKSDSLWGPILHGTWRSIATIEGRVAEEGDVKTGRAVFHIDGPSEPYHMRLPSLARWIDSDVPGELVVVIQAESTKNGPVLGVRPVTGGNAVVTLEELELLDVDEQDLW